MRWIVGDVQGCALELEQLLETVRFDPSRDELWVAGDFVNKGPDSLAALRLWRDVDGHGVIGNHDVYALLAASGSGKRKSGDTLGELFAADDADELLDRVRQLPILKRLPGPDGQPDVWLVHAGFAPSWDDPDAIAAASEIADHDDDWLRSAHVNVATRVRCCTADGEIARFSGPPEQCPPSYRPWDNFYHGPLVVVHGHWAMRGFYRGVRTIGLDSGCCYGGPLTAWCHEDDRVVQVPSRMSGKGPKRII